MFRKCVCLERYSFHPLYTELNSNQLYPNVKLYVNCLGKIKSVSSATDFNTVRTEFRQSGICMAVIGTAATDAAEMISTDHAVGFAELMPDFILQRSGQARQLWNLARQYGKTLEGHCPGLSDPELSAYASIGTG